VYGGVECNQAALVKTLINFLVKCGEFLGLLTVRSYSVNQFHQLVTQRTILTLDCS
jgi:hypothetical protein